MFISESWHGLSEDDIFLWSKWSDKPQCVKALKQALSNKDIITAFDIETAPVRAFNGEWDDAPESICYLWQFHVEGLPTIIGRNLSTWVDLINVIKGRTFYCWIHNASYEFQYLRSFLPVEKVFMRGSRKVQSFKVGNITFQCSAIMSGSSLRKFLMDMKIDAEYQKQSGEEFDYRAVRDENTALSEDNYLYARNDVLGLCKAIRAKMTATGYSTVKDLPKTSTGFVRADVKSALGYAKGFNPLDDIITHDADTLHALNMAYRGGNTHANRFESGKWHENVKSYDRTSSYPAVMMSYPFPTKVVRVGEALMKKLPTRFFIDEVLTAPVWYMYHVKLTNVKLKRYVSIPYLSYSNDEKVIAKKVKKDNGRILSASEVDMYLTHYDLAIIRYQYNYEMEILEAWCSETKMLPEPMREVIMQYFVNKCTLKDSDPQTYLESKQKLNGIYGMTSQNPFIESWVYTGDLNGSGCAVTAGDERQTFPFQWGVTVTALARIELQRGINACDSNFPLTRMLYTDTDSIKFEGETPKELESLIESLDKLAYDKGIVCGKKRLGTWEYEGFYTDFVTYGAKKYVVKHSDESCWKDEAGKWGITIAGVPKDEGSRQITSRESVKLGMVFTGKKIPKYFDNGEKGTSITLCDMTYELNITEDYKTLLMFPELLGLSENDVNSIMKGVISW